MFSGDDNVYVTAREIERAKPSWEKMSNSQREEYKELASKLKLKISNTQTRYNSLGQKLIDADIEKDKQEQEKNRRRNEIQKIIEDAADSSELDTMTFYFVSASSFYDDNKTIYPAEIALAKYSLKDGLYDSMSIDINPGELPVGAAYKAKSIASASHKYPLPPDNFGESDYLKILMKIVDFLPQNEELPIFFTEGIADEYLSDSKALKDTQRILKLIFEKAREYDIARELKVYSIIELFYYLKEISDSKEIPFKSFADANSVFNKSDIEYFFRTDACEYHEIEEAHKHCCLSKCIRYGYILSKWCAQGFKYDLKPGFHFPKSLSNINS